LLGLAQDTHIRAILTRLSLENQITSFCSPEGVNLLEAWSPPGTKCLKRLFALTRLCGPKLVSLLSSSNSRQVMSIHTSRPGITASEALTTLLKNRETMDRSGGTLVENQLIAAKTQVRIIPALLILDRSNSILVNYFYW
jgi:hypothetical protein